MKNYATGKKKSGVIFTCANMERVFKKEVVEIHIQCGTKYIKHCNLLECVGIHKWNTFEQLPYARHCCKCFTQINSFNPTKPLWNRFYYCPHFCREKTEA